MNVSAVFDRIFKAQKQREESRARDYRSLVAEIADGKEPPADRLDEILMASGKTVEQLRADAELHQQRRAWREQYDALPRLNEEKAVIEQQIAETEEGRPAAIRCGRESAARPVAPSPRDAEPGRGGKGPVAGHESS